jgi:NADH:ubiquinone oxidoreductase subunit 3 (subunit A)
MEAFTRPGSCYKFSLAMPSGAPGTSFLGAHAAIAIFVAVAIGFLVVNLLVWKIIRPSRYSEEKLTTYECGENPTGSAWIQFNIRFYVFALIFIVFDVEAVFLLPWAVVFRQLGPLAFVEGLVFIAILLVALAYVWRKGDLEWVRAEDRR